ncbi:MAG: hypothetical protein M3447_10440, partial [Acidobacteriota bacterium]|nr:hypothetical protein [Acidobacteriota bacterium]
QVPFDYYAGRDDLIEKPFPDYSSELRKDNLADLLKSAIEGHDRIWLVLSHESELAPLIPQQLILWYALSAHEISPGVEMYLFEKRK